MICAWQEFLNIVPPSVKEQVDKRGRSELNELRFRSNQAVEMVLSTRSIWLDKIATVNDLSYCINAASNYSPWAAETISDGYITAHGGHRVGICGIVSVHTKQVLSIRTPLSLCLRVARDFPGLAADRDLMNGSVLIIGKPGSGKTTLLRDLIRSRSNAGEGVSVVDERGEIFPLSKNQYAFAPGMKTDVISGCTKKQGINAVLRSMCPDMIAVDEITAEEDCNALLHAGWCGVELVATAHAGNIQDLKSRQLYKPIIDSGLFDTVVVMNPDKTWYLERLKQ